MSIKKLFENNDGIDAYYITSAVNRKYFTGFTSSAGYLLATKGKTVFITDYRYFEDAKQIIAGGEIEVRVYESREELPALLVGAFAEAGVKTVGFEDNRLSYADYLALKDRFADFELVPAWAKIDTARQIKTAAEIEKIEHASSINDKVFAHMCKFFKAGYTERDCAIELDHHVRKLGGDGNAFETIMAFGANSSKPHSIPGNKKLEAGDMILMDYGTKYAGYCSDITRTVCFGKPKEPFADIYNIVLQAQKAAIQNIREGALCREVDFVAREIIKANNYEKNFNHRLGHCVGLEIHEAPSLAEGEDVLKTGMVVTVEPGIYLEGLGGVRIEDLVTVTENGMRNLTRAQKDKLLIL